MVEWLMTAIIVGTPPSVAICPSSGTGLDAEGPLAGLHPPVD